MDSASSAVLISHCLHAVSDMSSACSVDPPLSGTVVHDMPSATKHQCPFHDVSLLPTGRCSQHCMRMTTFHALLNAAPDWQLDFNVSSDLYIGTKSVITILVALHAAPTFSASRQICHQHPYTTACVLAAIADWSSHNTSRSTEHL